MSAAEVRDRLAALLPSLANVRSEGGMVGIWLASWDAAALADDLDQVHLAVVEVERLTAALADTEARVAEGDDALAKVARTCSRIRSLRDMCMIDNHIADRLMTELGGALDGGPS